MIKERCQSEPCRRLRGRAFALTLRQAQDDTRRAICYVQKLPFAFLLSAFCLLTACSLNPNMQGQGENYLQGEWQQDPTPVQKQLVTYSLYHFTFTCDSVYIKQQTFSKVNYGSDTCMNNGHWTEYIRGTYTQRHDTLYLKGVFCNADHSLK